MDERSKALRPESNRLRGDNISPVECSPSMIEALDSIPSTEKRSTCKQALMWVKLKILERRPREGHAG